MVFSLPLFLLNYIAWLAAQLPYKYTKKKNAGRDIGKIVLVL